MVGFPHGTVLLQEGNHHFPVVETSGPVRRWDSDSVTENCVNSTLQVDLAAFLLLRMIFHGDNEGLSFSDRTSSIFRALTVTSLALELVLQPRTGKSWKIYGASAV